MAEFTLSTRVQVAQPIDSTDYASFSICGNKIVRDANGRLWAWSYRNDGGYANNVVIHYSDDDGQSWSAGEAVATHAAEGRRECGLVIDNTGKPVVSIAKDGTLNLQTFWRREGDDPTPAWTYLSGADVDWESNIPDGTQQNFIQDRVTGYWHVVYYRSSSGTVVRHRVSTDDLASWGSENSVATLINTTVMFGNGATSLFFNSTGDLLLGGVDKWFHPSAVGMAVQRWNGTSWSRVDTSDVGVAGGVGCAFDISDDESLFIAAIGGVNSGEQLSVYTSPASGGVWTSRTVPGTKTRHGGCKLFVAADGRVHLVSSNWPGGTSDVVRYWYSDDHGVTWVGDEVIVSNGLLSGGWHANQISRWNSLHFPDVGTVVLLHRITGVSATSEDLFLGTDDVSWPTIAAGTRITRIVLRVLGTPADPISPLDLPTDLPPLLANNWETGVEIETTYQSDVQASFDSSSEERRSLMERPYRTLRAQFTGVTQVDSNRMLSLIARHANARSVIPLYSDHSKTTATSSGTTIWCDTRWRRFVRLGRVVVFDWTERHRPTNVEYRIISKILADRLILTTNLSNSHAAGGRVMPVLDCEITLEQSQELLSDHVANLMFSAVEVIGYSALPALTTGDPPDFSSYNGFAVLDISPNWAESQTVGMSRDGDSVPVGKGRFVEVYGTRPRATYDLAFTLPSRRVAWRLLRFIESRRGRVRPFWLIGAQSLWRLSAITTTYADVKADGDLDDLEAFFPYVAVHRKDGTIDMRTIDSITDNGTTWRLTFDATIPSPVSLALVRRITAGHFVRLNIDSHREKWTTDELCAVRIQVVDLLAEQDVEMGL